MSGGVCVLSITGSSERSHSHRGRLIQVDHFGIPNKTDGHTQPAFHTSRVLPGLLACNIKQVHTLQPRGDGLFQRLLCSGYVMRLSATHSLLLLKAMHQIIIDTYIPHAQHHRSSHCQIP